MSVDIYTVSATILLAVVIATIARFVFRKDAERGTWTRWFEVGVILTFVGLIALLLIGFLTAPTPVD